MKRGVLLGILMAGVAFVCSGCQSSGNWQGETSYTSSVTQTETEIDENLIVVGVSQVGAESDWRIAQTNSIKEELTTENGFYMIFDNAQQKQENQIKAVRNFILQEVDYIVLDPIVVSGWDNVLQNAKDAGIPVIVIDRNVELEDDSLYVTSILTDSEAEGRNAGYWLADYLEEQGRDEENTILSCFLEQKAHLHRSDELKDLQKLQRIMRTGRYWNSLAGILHRQRVENPWRHCWKSMTISM